MATVGFVPKTGGTNWTSFVVSRPASLPQGQSVLLAQSDSISNNSGQQALRIGITFDSITPDTSGNSFNIVTIIQGQDDAGNWYNVGYQFSPFRFTGTAPERQIIIDPNLLSFDEGIPISIDNGSKEISRLSKQRGVLPPTSFRICLYITDYDPSSGDSFQSCTISAAGERYDVA